MGLYDRDYMRVGKMESYDRDRIIKFDKNRSNFKKDVNSFSLSLWIVTIILVSSFIYDIYKTRIIHIHNFGIYAFSSYSALSVLFLILSISRRFRVFYKFSLKVIGVVFLGILIIVYLPKEVSFSNALDFIYQRQNASTTQNSSQSASYENNYKVQLLVQDQSLIYYNQGIEDLKKGHYDKAMLNFKKAISLNPKLYNNLTSQFKFDTENFESDTINTDNLFAASIRLLKWENTNIKNAQKVSSEDLFKHTWKYVGKLVFLTVDVIQPQELAPSNILSQLLNPGGPSTVFLSSIEIGGAGDSIQYHYGRSYEGFDANDKVNICGYVIGKVELTNRLGGTSHNIIIAGKYLKKLEK